MTTNTTIHNVASCAHVITHAVPSVNKRGPRTLCLSSPHALLKGTGGSREFLLLILTPGADKCPKAAPHAPRSFCRSSQRIRCPLCNCQSHTTSAGRLTQGRGREACAQVTSPSQQLHEHGSHLCAQPGGPPLQPQQRADEGPFRVFLPVRKLEGLPLRKALEEGPGWVFLSTPAWTQSDCPRPNSPPASPVP